MCLLPHLHSGGEGSSCSLVLTFNLPLRSQDAQYLQLCLGEIQKGDMSSLLKQGRSGIEGDHCSDIQVNK